MSHLTIPPELLRGLCLIDGAWCAADNGARFSVLNPATGEPICNVPNMGAAETQRTIHAAAAAQKKWQAYSGKERAQILRAWFDLIGKHQEELATLMTLEQGKPLTEARGEITYAASFVEWFAEEAKRIDGDVLPHPQRDQRIIVLKQPIGVVAAITPWNFPAAMVTRKVAPALAAGCTIVVKPAEQTPLTALALAELAQRAGVPAGVFNVITGDAIAIGGELTSNPIVRKLSFTGSTEVGRLLMAQCAPTIKKVSLELGGNAPFIVFDDADLDAAVAGAMISKFRNTGQTCVCANRFYVHAQVAEAFAQKLAAAAAALVVGNGLENGVQQGPLIDKSALAKVQEHIHDAQAQGARLLQGGQCHALGGTYFTPTVLTGVTENMRLSNEETFGPVAGIRIFHSDAEVVRWANDTEFGLAAYFYAQNMQRIWRVAEALECGMVGINTGLISNEVGPFGGIKQSGLGREGSKYGIEEYLECKYLCLGGMGEPL